MSNRATSHQILALITVWLNKVATGHVNGWLIALNITSYPEVSSVISVIFWLGITGRIFGAILAAILLDKVGRKSLLVIGGITFSLSWLVILFLIFLSSTSYILFSLVIAVSSTAGGINEVSNSAYLGEICSPSNRSKFGTICISAFFFGSLIIGFLPVLGFLDGIIIVIIINICVSLLSLISIFWIIEPVQYLLMKGKNDPAKKNFAYLNDANNPDQLAAEFEKIRQNVYSEISKKSSWGTIFKSPANYKSLLIVSTIYSLAGMIGSQYATPFIEYPFAKPYDDTFKFSTFLLGGVLSLIAVLSSFVTGRFNRKSVILLSFSLISLAHALTAMIYRVDQLVSLPDSFWSIGVDGGQIFAACTYAFAYPTLFILRSELFPLSIKGYGSSICIIVHLVMIYFTDYIIQLQRFDFYSTYVFFSIASAAFVLFVYFKLPETRNKSLIEIQENLEKE